MLRCWPSDIDADGLMLTLDMVRFLSVHGVKACPVLMSTQELALSAGCFQGSERLNLDDSALDDMFGDVVDQVRQGVAMEQEELLLHYHKIALNYLEIFILLVFFCISY